MEIEWGPVQLELPNGLLFTWDDEKEKKNRKKHGIDFLSAASVFLNEDVVFDENCVDEYTGEERFDATAQLYGQIVVVVYVERITVERKKIFRLISARKANPEERKEYVSRLQ